MIVLDATYECGIDPDHGANMGLICVLSAPDGLHVGTMNLAIRGVTA